jgi:PAS domain S-box-containing protein
MSGHHVKTNFEKEITSANGNFYYIMKHIPVGIEFIESQNGKITYANDRAIELYGVDPSGLEIKDQSTKLFKIYRANGEPYPLEDLPISRALKGANVVNEELIIERRKDNSRITVSITAVALHDDNNKIVGAVDVLEDISGRKQQESLQQMAAIGRTAGMVGHDIRNPLQGIVGDVYLLKDYLTAKPECKSADVLESLEEIEKNVGYIDKIVADLQDYSRPLKLERIEANLYDSVTSAFQSIAIPDNVTPSIDIDPSIQLKSDPTVLRRVLTNLIINAFQAMPNGGNLIIRGAQNNNKTSIYVKDSGVGIPDDVKPKIFTPMMTTKSKGQGLGLAVVKRLVEAQGGTISFESQVGKGATFIIEFPIISVY